MIGIVVTTVAWVGVTLLTRPVGGHVEPPAALVGGQAGHVGQVGKEPRHRGEHLLAKAFPVVNA